MQEQQSVYGIIGYPVEHSLSPAMHNTAFKELGVDAVYKLFPLKEDELESFFVQLRGMNSPIYGLNVTVPYKSAVLPYLDTVSPLVEKICAVNTIVINDERKLIGHNTDAPGFLSHLTELHFNTRDKRIAILGAGGSARAILATLCMVPERPESIKLYNRTISRMDELLGELSERIDISIVEPVETTDELNIEISDMLINCTSVGLNKTDLSLIDKEMLHSGLLVYDLIYNPRETQLIKFANEKGAKTANGLGLLFYQGVLSLQHWANVELDEMTKLKMRESLEDKLNDQ